MLTGWLRRGHGNAAAPKPLSRPRQAAYRVLLVCLLVFLYFLVFEGMRFFRVPSGSMEPTIYPGDYIVTLRQDSYARGDIVVLSDPEELSGYIVKRIVGLEGDTVAVKGGALLLNGRYASEPYLREPMLYEMAPYEAPPGNVVVLGDDRNGSEDSHVWQSRSLPKDSIVGKVRFVYLPLARIRKIRPFPLVNSAGE